MKHLKIICLLMFVCISGIAQNSNFRAQGNYYSAKSNFENKDYSKALTYVNKCKTELGGTNDQLQYLHILIAYRLNQYDEAAKELQVFFDISDKKIEAVRFDKSVDELTDDEAKALTMLIDPIMESAAKKKNNPCPLCKGSGFTIPCDYCKSKGFFKIDCPGAGLICHNGKVVCQCRTCKGMNWDNFCSDGRHHWTNGSLLLGNRTNHSASCETCNGSGKVDCSKCNGVGYLKNDCTHCNGKGSIATTSSSSEKVKCAKCYGVGF